MPSPTNETGRVVFAAAKGTSPRLEATVSGVQPPVAWGVTSIAPAHWVAMQAATKKAAAVLGKLLVATTGALGA